MQEIQWSPTPVSDAPSRNAVFALKAAAVAAQQFDAKFSLKHPEREASIALLYAEEVTTDAAAAQHMGFYRELPVTAMPLRNDLARGAFGKQAQVVRERLAERASDSAYYVCKFLQPGLVDQSGHGPTAAAEMITEVKILMNLEPHPHIAQLYACNAKGIDAFLDKGYHSFFFVTDRLQGTLAERIDCVWRQKTVPLSERLEVGMDISSGLRFLHDRKVVYYLRPDKIGFDLRHNGRVKLCHFTQARQEGMEDVAPSITKSDDVSHTLAYTAPEILCNAPAICSSDVYAFAILLWEMITLRRPFSGYDRFTHFSRAVQGHERPSLNHVQSKALRELLSTAWHPHYRPTMKTLNEVLETILLSDNPDNSSIDVTEILNKHQVAEHELNTAAALSRRAANKTEKSSRGTRSVRAKSTGNGAIKDEPHQLTASLDKLVINGSTAPSWSRQHAEEGSVGTTPTVRSNGSTGTGSMAYQSTYVAHSNQSGRSSRNLSVRKSPVPSYNGVKAGQSKSKVSGVSQLDNPSLSPPGGASSADSSGKSPKTSKPALRRRKSDNNMRLMAQNKMLPLESSSGPPSKASDRRPSPENHRKHHRSASMSLAQRQASVTENILSSPHYDKPYMQMGSTKSKSNSKRRPSLSGPRAPPPAPAAAFKLDMIPEPAPRQPRKASTLSFGLAGAELMGVDNKDLDANSAAFPTAGVDHPVRIHRDLSQRAARTGPSCREKSPSLRSGLRSKSSAAHGSTQSPHGRRQPSLRQSSKGREILSHALDNFSSSDDDGVAMGDALRSQERRMRKSASGRRLVREKMSLSISDDEQIRGGPSGLPRGCSRESVSDDEVRDTFSARLRAEMMKSDATGSGKVIRVKVKSKKPTD